MRPGANPRRAATACPTPEKMSAGEDAPGRQPAKSRNHLPYAFAIARRRCGKWRAFGPLLAERKVVSQYGVASLGECARHHLQLRRIAIGACAVRQRQSIAVWLLGRVQYAADAIRFECLF